MTTFFESDWPYAVTAKHTSTGQWRDLRIWLIDNVKTYTYFICDDYVVRFTKEQDATLFALRWA